MRKKNTQVNTENTSENSVENTTISKPTKEKENKFKKYEGLIVIVLAVICLIGILFAVQKSRDTGEEVLPQEGTQLVTNNKEQTNTNDEEQPDNDVLTQGDNQTVTDNEEQVNEVESETISDEEFGTLTDEDLSFPIYGYDTYIDYVNAGNTGAVFIVDDNAEAILNGDLVFDDVENNDRHTQTMRGIKIGDFITKVFDAYKLPPIYDINNRSAFNYSSKEYAGEYTYLYKSDLSEEYFYSLTFMVDQNKEILAVLLEPISMEYWTDNSTE